MSIKITLLNKPYGFKEAIHGMRNPKNSWDKSDSYETFVENYETGNHAPFAFFVGDKDLDLMLSLAKGGPVHAKYRRFINVYLDVEAPLYWWKEFDTYRIGETPHPTDLEMNSCSTMHKIADKEFTQDDFASEHLLDEILTANITLSNGEKTQTGVSALGILNLTILLLNYYRKKYLEETDPEMKKVYWWQLIQMLPSSYIQKRTLMVNYETLANMYFSRHDHKQDEWRIFCQVIENLPYSQIITGDMPPVVLEPLPKPKKNKKPSAPKKQKNAPIKKPTPAQKGTDAPKFSSPADNILVGRVARYLKDGMKPKAISEAVKQPMERVQEIIKLVKAADKRRADVKKLHGKGYTTKEIAEKFGISESTVRRIVRE